MRLILALAAALTLSACATTNRVDAAGDVHAFLTSVRNSDRALFERHVDRDALKLQIESRILQEARGSDLNNDLKKAAAILARPVADLAGSALIRPSVFRAAAVTLGYDPAKPLPSQLAIAGFLKGVDRNHVCAVAARGEPCLFTFERQDGVWRLVRFEGELGELEL
jgi:hypothetical protein